MRHTISALVENKFGVLARVAGMFSGRGFNIDTLNVGPTHDPKYSRITITLRAQEHALDMAIKQLDRLINVIDITHFGQRNAFVARELVMLKVSASGDTRSKVIEVCDIFRAKVIDVTPVAIIIECTGNENKIRAFLELITPFGILELARTGNVALLRGAPAETEED
ncbi:acetolactate synthase small subunit [Cerasicoccus arenae]|uniref:Acetolactate synthase small subunit n=1 Tax=Cerasicoccus arenae TaxID=424488 RepID=A0A8J3GEX7_9BACT|nr:acetolactate synthase small subunit [Cerasicoccus arenae]MBK1858751.1 acetolactate synthase small subunit [Cerasicoccus arenae]GHC07282.1 acetolactate synthase small subunit [Cerasicoccus arenae]